MSRLLKLLSHSAWQGIGAVATIATLMLAVYSAYLVKEQHDLQKNPHQVVNQNVNTDGQNVPRKDNDTPQTEVNEIINSSLGSIDENYRGVHAYFNDSKSVGVLAIICAVVACCAFLLGRNTGTKL